MAEKSKIKMMYGSLDKTPFEIGAGLTSKINSITSENLNSVNIPTITLQTAGLWSIETGIYYNHENKTIFDHWNQVFLDVDISDEEKVTRKQHHKETFRQRRFYVVDRNNPEKSGKTQETRV